MSFVLDASVALSWVFADEGGGESDRLLRRTGEQEAVVSAVWGLEVVNALLVAERRGRIGASDVAGACGFLLGLPITPDPPRRSRPFEVLPPISRRHGLSAYDASHLELALRTALPLATFDAALRAAADDEGVEPA